MKWDCVRIVILAFRPALDQEDCVRILIFALRPTTVFQ